MHIFLDTTVTFTDPFFKKNYNRNLLKLAREFRDINFYMSEIVYKETKRHFINNVKESFEILHKTENKLNNFRQGFFEKNISKKIDDEVKKLLNDFEKFYIEIQNENILKILPCPNYILPELIERSVNRIKPFKEHKSEFRDAATWLTYSSYLKQNKLNDCYFITENVADFYDDEKKNIHPELLNDTKEFKPFLTLMKLAQDDPKVKQYLEEKQQKEQEIQKWIEENNIDEKFVKKYFDLEPSSLNGINSEVYHLCIDFILSMIELGRLYTEPQLDLNDIDITIDITDIQDFLIEIISEEIIVSGELLITAGGQYMEKRFLTNLELILPFSFIMIRDEDKPIHNLQLEKIGINPKINQTLFF
ncbi:PIN domain-containing protein [Gottfriedia acidiceleris]|uniref:PIN domain-containing protein n=1 Tax=Gottfriedia acidiceleris TaxID=371036 RepID=UPI0013EC79B3|nr:PIN domain-containing protein [Gottfriedia acidiceleris]